MLVKNLLLKIQINCNWNVYVQVFIEVLKINVSVNQDFKNFIHSKIIANVLMVFINSPMELENMTTIVYVKNINIISYKLDYYIKNYKRMWPFNTLYNKIK